MDKKNPSRIKNSAILGISTLTGCVGLIIVLGALILGLSVGDQFGQRGPTVVCFVSLSAPLSLLAMTTLALGTLRWLRDKNQASSEDSNEEDIT